MEERRKEHYYVGSHAGPDKRGESGTRVDNSASILSAGLGLFDIFHHVGPQQSQRQTYVIPCWQVRRVPQSRDPLRQPSPCWHPLETLSTFCFGAEHAPPPQQLPDQPENPILVVLFNSPGGMFRAVRFRLDLHKRRCSIGDAVILPSVTAWLLCVAGEQCYCGWHSKHCHTPPQGQSRPNVLRRKGACKQWNGGAAAQPRSWELGAAQTGTAELGAC